MIPEHRANLKNQLGVIPKQNSWQKKSPNAISFDFDLLVRGVPWSTCPSHPGPYIGEARRPFEGEHSHSQTTPRKATQVNSALTPPPSGAEKHFKEHKEIPVTLWEIIFNLELCTRLNDQLRMRWKESRYFQTFRKGVHSLTHFLTQKSHSGDLSQEPELSI